MNLSGERLKEIKKWNREGKPSAWVDPPTFYYLPKFPFVVGKLQSLKVKKILDVGCHTGYLLRYLAESGYKCVGVDIQKENMELANKISKGNPKFYFLNAERLSFKFKKEFDAVILLDVLEHCLNDKKVIKEVKKVTKKDGWVFINLPKNCEYPDDSGEHIRDYNEQNIKEFLGQEKNFNLEMCSDEYGRPTSFISFQV